ncbi:hypothetical protein B0I35DRAFT_444290 [Stachybotrys elegans]|uniref:Uncharacterized protein n=1 Tax=Stachybotrys elegans TaxID=80388 RepID=A0A8K0WK52_9HYPO|nr:hypothetical protein B0I35DRAFT_444290 [Stachybotrys elegans]
MVTTRSMSASAGSNDSLLSAQADSQSESPLFRLLPGEVRRNIYDMVLADFSDPSPEKRYEDKTCYTRPSYYAPRKTDFNLLLTCRAIYRECWFLPMTLREMTFWLTHQSRAPPTERAGDDYARPQASTISLANRLRHTSDQLGETLELESIRFFAQMYVLEEGRLHETLSRSPLCHVHFRRLTLTIRHQDWWFWERDEPLRFEAGWIAKACEALPATLRELTIELESLERKKKQIDAIANKMSERWFFVRGDGVPLLANAKPGSHHVARWRGSSTWMDERWIRDETDNGVLDYYIASVRFRLLRNLERDGGMVSPKALEAAKAGEFNERSLRLDLPGAKPMKYSGKASLRVNSQRWTRVG